MNKQDIAVVYNIATGTRDMAIGGDGDFQAVDDYSTSIDLSILTNRRANGSEVPEAILRRGWIGDLTPKKIGQKVGSKVWLFEQSRRTYDTLNGVRDAVYDSLLWMVEDNQADRISVSAEFLDNNSIFVTVYIFVGSNTIRRYFNLFANMEERLI